jgi:hypothetical protein
MLVNSSHSTVRSAPRAGCGVHTATTMHAVNTALPEAVPGIRNLLIISILLDPLKNVGPKNKPITGQKGLESQVVIGERNGPTSASKRGPLGRGYQHPPITQQQSYKVSLSFLLLFSFSL